MAWIKRSPRGRRAKDLIWKRPYLTKLILLLYSRAEIKKLLLFQQRSPFALLCKENTVRSVLSRSPC